MSNATTYQSGGSGNAYSGTNASTNAYQNSGTSANLYQSAGSGSGGSYPTPGTVNSELLLSIRIFYRN